jgi:hypothetical protein
MEASEDRDRRLQAALRALAEDEAHLRASAAVEARLLVEVRSIARARRRRRQAAVLTTAAALLVAVAVPVWRRTSPRRVATTPLPAVETSAREVATAFFPLTYHDVPLIDGQIVRLEVPRAALGSFGLLSFDSLDTSPSATVTADVLVGEDGLARAVRFVRVATFRSASHGIDVSR